MLCFLPPIFPMPEYPPFAPPPKASGAAAFILIAIATVGLLTPVGWTRTQPEYALRVGVASQLGPRPVETALVSHLDRSGTVDGAPHKPYAFFGQHDAYIAVPPGLTVDAATGALVGVPSMAGSYTVAVGVSDGMKSSLTGPSFKVKVLPAL